MRKNKFIVSLLSITLLTSCNNIKPDNIKMKVSQPGDINKDVLALLPKGSYNVTGGFNNTERQIVTIDGYVHYGTDPDGKDCKADYIITDLRDNGTSSTFVTKQRSIHNPGGTSWYQNISDPEKPGQWIDHADPNSPQIALLFAPNIITDDWGVGPVDGAGKGQLCAIPLMARIMKIDKGELLYDKLRSEATSKARMDRWAEYFIDAVGTTGEIREYALDKLKSIITPTFDNLIENTNIKINRKVDGSYEILQMDKTGKISVRLIFTPTASKTIESISSKTYFTKLTEEVKRSGLTPREFIDKGDLFYRE